MNRLAMFAVAASISLVSVCASAAADPDLSIPGVGDVTVTHATVTGCSAAPGQRTSLAGFVIAGLGLVGLSARRRRATGRP